MNRTFRRFATVALLSFAIAGGVFAVGLSRSEKTHLVKVQLDVTTAKQIEDRAFGVGLTLTNVPDDSTIQFNSPLMVYEDDRPLGPAHTPQPFVARQGNGSFNHFKNWLVFSASDNSDPRTNARTYSVGFERSPSLRTTVLILIGYVFAFTFGILALSKALSVLPIWSIARTAIALTLVAILCLGASELFGRAALNILFEQSGAYYRSLHAHIFGLDDPRSHDVGWGSAQFMPSAYTIYALNPDVHRWKKGEINADYLIRRLEPIRDRKDVRFRIVVLGGSTTNDTLIADETKTWVYGVEKRLRSKFGDDVDVINGGVSGYTLYENFFHYVSALSALEPDVVLLYEGINDVHPRLFANSPPDYRHYNKPSWGAEAATIRRDESPLRHLAAYRFWKMRGDKGILALLNGIGAFTRNPEPPHAEWVANLQKNPPTTYERTMTNFTAMIQGRGRKVGIIPQHFVRFYDSDEPYKIGVDEHNEVNRKVAAARSAPFLDRILAAAAFRRDDLNDNCHFNETGADRMAEMVFQYLVDNRLVPEASH